MIEPAGAGVGFGSLPQLRRCAWPPCSGFKCGGDRRGAREPPCGPSALAGRRTTRPARREEYKTTPSPSGGKALPTPAPAVPRPVRRHPGRATGIGVRRRAHPPPRARGISHTRAPACASGATSTASERMQVILPASQSLCASVIVSDTWQLSCCFGRHVDDFPRRLPAGIHIEAVIGKPRRTPVPRCRHAERIRPHRRS